MDAMQAVSTQRIDPSYLRQIMAELEKIDPARAQNLYAQLWQHPDLYEQVAESAGAQSGGGDAAMQGGAEDMAQLMVEYALRASDQGGQPQGRNLGSLSAVPQGAAAPVAATGATPTGATPTGAAGATPTGNAAVDKAMEYVGNTAYNYSHARPPPAGQLDCSQLVSEVYGLPPDVVTQGSMGTPKDISQAQAGDLVFFDEDGSGVATHVGIADGKGNIVHASQAAGEVTVTPIADIPSTRTWATSPP
jgi:cell wall-associated NlpC family hydrolase